METINILHASDLHISEEENNLSVLDLPKEDLKLTRLPQLTKIAISQWWKKNAASSYNPTLLKLLADFIYKNAKKKLDKNGQEVYNLDAEIDAVVLTGDLATKGTSEDIELVRKFLSAQYDPRKPSRSIERDYKGATLSAVKVPVVYLPGNHDRYIPTRGKNKVYK